MAIEEAKIGKKDNGIYLWEKMKAIILPDEQTIFFENVEPFQQVTSGGSSSSDFEEYECFPSKKDGTVYMRVYCPYISSKTQLCVSYREFAPLLLDTREDVFRALALISRFHAKAQKHLNEVILKKIKNESA